jgi:cytochrome P450
VCAAQIDPYADEFQQSPFTAYAALRATTPVYQVPDHGFYLVTTHALVREVLHDPVTYANSVTSARRTEPPPEIAGQIAAIRAQGFAYQSALGLSDPPRHTRYRKIVQRAFVPRSLAWMEPIISTASRELVAALPSPGTVDIVRALAWPVPVYAISRILGLPDSWREDIGRWSDAATASLGAQLKPERWLQTEHDMIDYQHRISAELDERRAAPRDDVLSVLVQPDLDEGALSNGELVWFVRELMVAGNETTTKLITDMVLRLSDRPDQWRRLREDPARATVMVEEGLRLASPAQGMFRRVTRPVTLGGVPLPEGAVVFLSFLSANRDQTVFESPDEFNPDRRNVRQHLSFGQGIHGCLGNVLARMEATAVLRELAERVDRLEVVDPAAVRYLPSFFIRGIPELPVRVHPREAEPGALTGPSDSSRP